MRLVHSFACTPSKRKLKVNDHSGERVGMIADSDLLGLVTMINEIKIDLFVILLVYLVNKSQKTMIILVKGLGWLSMSSKSAIYLV